MAVQQKATGQTHQTAQQAAATYSSELKPAESTGQETKYRKSTATDKQNAGLQLHAQAERKVRAARGRCAAGAAVECGAGTGQ
jgi:hypothetical protein